LRELQKNCLFRVMPILDAQALVDPYLSKAGIVGPDFNKVFDRKAVGKAWVTIFHKRSLDDYLAALGRSSVAPQ
jgi:hypothetical protein